MKRCRKIIYGSFEEARDALEKVTRQTSYGEMLHIYRCPRCNKFHLGGLSYTYYVFKYKVHIG